MSRAFIKEDAGDSDDLPERPQSSAPNYVTPNGLARLRQKVQELRSALASETGEKRRKELLRDRTYYEGRLGRAILVETAGRKGDEVRFGATVEVVEASGARRRFVLVGQDEAEEDGGEKVAWDSATALALLGKKAGDSVELPGDGATIQARIEAISY